MRTRAVAPPFARGVVCISSHLRRLGVSAMGQVRPDKLRSRQLRGCQVLGTLLTCGVKYITFYGWVYMINIKTIALVALCLFTLPAVGRGLIDINTADTGTLAAIEGLSTSQATSIVHNREKYGPFRDAYDLLRVPGVLMKTIHSLQGRVMFTDTSARPQRVKAQLQHPFGQTNTEIVAKKNRMP